jgi:predicted AAA+ superfamily ATPase
MRANLDEKEKLVPPRNVERGLARLKQLHHEIGRIVDEIKKRKAGEATPGWTARVNKNLALLRSEAKQLTEWISHEHHAAGNKRALP